MLPLAFLSAVPSLFTNCEEVQLEATQVLEIVQQGPLASVRACDEEIRCLNRPRPRARSQLCGMSCLSQ
jgi:hypothetical protein